MSNTAIIVITVGVVVVVVVALLFNRRMKAGWGDKIVETGATTRHAMMAKGGSRIDGARQKGPGDKEMVAKDDSEIVDAEQEK